MNNFYHLIWQAVLVAVPFAVLFLVAIPLFLITVCVVQKRIAKLYPQARIDEEARYTILKLEEMCKVKDRHIRELQARLDVYARRRKAVKAALEIV